jgi:outer membrane cobalamin receptor
MRLVLGARELWSSEYGFVFLYKGGLRLTLPHGLSFRARIVRNYRQPTLRERFLPFPTVNPDLDPEYSLNIDLSLTASLGPVEISVSGYRTSAENMIRTFGSWPTAEVINIDEIEIFGLEAHLRLLRLGPMSLFLGGCWQDVGRYTRQNPSAKLNFSLDLDHEFGRHRIAGSFSGEWVRGLFQENYGRKPMDDVFFLDLSLRYSIEASPRVTLTPYLIVRNLLNARYEYISGYPMPGINVMAGLALSL